MGDKENGIGCIAGSMDLIETNQSMDIDSNLIRRRLRGGGRRLLEEEKVRVSLYSMFILLVST